LPIALSAAPAPASAQQQGIDPASAAYIQRYFSNGADATSVSSNGKAAAEFFSNGANATSVPAAGQPGADYFSNGAAATGVSSAGPAVREFFSHGTDATRAGPNADTSPYFSRGAEVTSVPPAGQLGSEYFSNGAAVMSLPLSQPATPPTPPNEEPAAAEPEPPPPTAASAAPPPMSVEPSPNPPDGAASPEQAPNSIAAPSSGSDEAPAQDRVDRPDDREQASNAKLHSARVPGPGAQAVAQTRRPNRSSSFATLLKPLATFARLGALGLVLFSAGGLALVFGWPNARRER
jgi:hypothetical protein